METRKRKDESPYQELRVEGHNEAYTGSIQKCFK